MSKNSGVALTAVSVWGRISDNEVRIFHVDGITHALINITEEHHKIHEGDHFTCAFPKTLGVSTISNMLIVTPDTTKWAHLIFWVISDSAVTVSLYEAPDYSGGAAQACFNNNRNNTKTTGLTFTTDATDDGGGLGTLLFQAKAGANNRAGIISRGDEFVLKQNTKYLVKIDGANGDVTTTVLDHYEHVNKT